MDPVSTTTNDFITKQIQVNNFNQINVIEHDDETKTISWLDLNDCSNSIVFGSATIDKNGELINSYMESTIIDNFNYIISQSLDYYGLMEEFEQLKKDPIRESVILRNGQAFYIINNQEIPFNNHMFKELALKNFNENSMDLRDKMAGYLIDFKNFDKNIFNQVLNIYKNVNKPSIRVLQKIA